MMDRIEMFAASGRIAITLAPAISKWTKTRNITPASALAIAALMMRSGTLAETMSAFGEPEIACQVAGGPEKQAWLGIQAWGYEGDPDLTAVLTGPVVTEIGKGLHQLYMEITGSGMTGGQCSIFTRWVSGYYLHQNGGGDAISDLGLLDPRHP